MTGIKVIFVPEDDRRPVIRMKIDASDTLAELQRMVAGYVQAVELPGFAGATVWMNEEGKLIGGMGRNVRATALLASVLMPGDYVAGPAVITGVTPQGRVTDAPAELLDIAST